MIEGLSESPLAFAAGCALWVPMAIWVVVLLGWMVTGDIDVPMGFLGIGAAVSLGYLGMNPPTPILPPLLLVAGVATLVLYPFAQYSLNQVALRAIDLEALDRAYESMGPAKESVSARLRIAKSLANLGYIGHAAAIADKALAGADKNIFREEMWQLRSWKERARDPRVPPVRPFDCIHCGKRSDPEELLCSRCGAPLLSDFARGKWLRPGLKSKILLVWLGAILLMIGIPTLATTLPPLLGVVAVIVALAIGGAGLTFAWRKAGGAT